MTPPARPAPELPPYFWLTIAAVGLGVTVLGVRLVSMSGAGWASAGYGILLGVVVTAGVIIGMRVRLVRKLRIAEQLAPTGTALPIAIGPETGAAFRWAATHLGDPDLQLASGGSAVVAVDASGLRLVRGSTAPHGVIPAAALAVADEPGRTMVGLTPRHSLVLTLTVDGVEAPLHLVPMRLRGNPFRGLDAPQRREVADRVRRALAGAPVEPGWPY